MNNQAKAAGYSAQKLHWQKHSLHGVQTSCKKRLSYMAEDNRSFFDVLKNYPEMACQKCAANFKEYVKIMIAKQSK